MKPGRAGSACQPRRSALPDGRLSLVLQRATSRRSRSTGRSHSRGCSSTNGSRSCRARRDTAIAFQSDPPDACAPQADPAGGAAGGRPAVDRHGAHRVLTRRSISPAARGRWRRRWARSRITCRRCHFAFNVADDAVSTDFGPLPEESGHAVDHQLDPPRAAMPRRRCAVDSERPRPRSLVAAGAAVAGRANIGARMRARRSWPAGGPRVRSCRAAIWARCGRTRRSRPAVRPPRRAARDDGRAPAGAAGAGRPAGRLRKALAVEAGQHFLRCWTALQPDALPEGVRRALCRAAARRGRRSRRSMPRPGPSSRPWWAGRPTDGASRRRSARARRGPCSSTRR